MRRTYVSQARFRSHPSGPSVRIGGSGFVRLRPLSGHAEPPHVLIIRAAALKAAASPVRGLVRIRVPESSSPAPLGASWHGLGHARRRVRAA